MKKILTLLFSIIELGAYAQNPVPVGASNSWVYIQGVGDFTNVWNGRLLDTTATKLIFPLKMVNRWALQDGILYYNPTGSRFIAIGGVPLDTTSLSLRIDQRVKYSDTSMMLAPYAADANLADSTLAMRQLIGTKLNSSDTVSLSNRINTKASQQALVDSLGAVRTSLLGKVNITDSNILYRTPSYIEQNFIRNQIASLQSASAWFSALRINSITFYNPAGTLNAGTLQYGGSGNMLFLLNGAGSVNWQGGSPNRSIATLDSGAFNLQLARKIYLPEFTTGPAGGGVPTYGVFGFNTTDSAIEIRISGVYYRMLSMKNMPNTPGRIPFVGTDSKSFTSSVNLFWSTTNSNMGVGTNAPNSSAILDLVSTTKGLGLPSMTLSQRDAVASPRAGLKAYVTDGNYESMYNGINWTGDMVVSSAGTLILTHGDHFVFTGTTTTWTLPAVSASLLSDANKITIKNRGSGDITLNSNAGNTIYSTTATGSITIAAGSSVTLVPDGTYFNVE